MLVRTLCPNLQERQLQLHEAKEGIYWVTELKSPKEELTSGIAHEQLDLLSLNSVLHHIRPQVVAPGNLDSLHFTTSCSRRKEPLLLSPEEARTSKTHQLGHMPSLNQPLESRENDVLIAQAKTYGIPWSPGRTEHHLNLLPEEKQILEEGDLGAKQQLTPG